jgi:hypothetical protein
MGLLQKIWRSRPTTTAPSAEQNDELALLREESAALLDEIQALKLDISDLQIQNEQLTKQLMQSRSYRHLWLTGGGVMMLLITYAILKMFNESNIIIGGALVLEAIFMWFMLTQKEHRHD